MQPFFPVVLYTVMNTAKGIRFHKIIISVMGTYFPPCIPDLYGQPNNVNKQWLWKTCEKVVHTSKAFPTFMAVHVI